ncbi:MAG: V-type ATP synthase subunit E [Sedimentibacter sp.]
MITIEEKIKLFYKLLNQSMDIHLAEDLKDMENSYKFKLEKLKSNVDKEAKEIEDRALKRAEIKRAESISKSKVIIKKDIMALKEKYYYTFMDKFKTTLKEFANSNEYKTYLSNIISKLSEDIKNYDNSDVVIYVTNRDKEKYSEFIKSEISKNIPNNIVFKTTGNIIGGLIAEFTEKNIKIDMSIDAVLEDNKTYIMQTIFETLEAGDYND